jgi:hypothetical protein
MYRTLVAFKQIFSLFFLRSIFCGLLSQVKRGLREIHTYDIKEGRKRIKKKERISPGWLWREGKLPPVSKRSRADPPPSAGHNTLSQTRTHHVWRRKHVHSTCGDENTYGTDAVLRTKMGDLEPMAEDVPNKYFLLTKLLLTKQETMLCIVLLVKAVHEQSRWPIRFV